MLGETAVAARVYAIGKRPGYPDGDAGLLGRPVSGRVDAAGSLERAEKRQQSAATDAGFSILRRLRFRPLSSQAKGAGVFCRSKESIIAERGGATWTAQLRPFWARSDSPVLAITERR